VNAIPGLVINQAESTAEIAQARELFLEYAGSLGFSLCFQGFDQELANLPGDYALPQGRLLLAEYHGSLAGCAALHKLEPGINEMKRLYVRPQFRGKQIGRLLAEYLIAEAAVAGYKRIRLDTIEPLMSSAVSLYRTLGFREIAPYRTNPIEGALYMELEC
jgi:GNAT superfamily N-acetyltransferase